MTQMFIPEESGPLLVLPELDCCSFSQHSNTERYCKRLSGFRHTLPYFHCGVAVQVPLGNQAESPQLAKKLLLLPIGSEA